MPLDSIADEKAWRVRPDGWGEGGNKRGKRDGYLESQQYMDQKVALFWRQTDNKRKGRRWLDDRWVSMRDRQTSASGWGLLCASRFFGASPKLQVQGGLGVAADDRIQRVSEYE